VPNNFLSQDTTPLVNSVHAVQGQEQLFQHSKAKEGFVRNIKSQASPFNTGYGPDVIHITPHEVPLIGKNTDCVPSQFLQSDVFAEQSAATSEQSAAIFETPAKEPAYQVQVQTQASQQPSSDALPQVEISITVQGQVDSAIPPAESLEPMPNDAVPSPQQTTSLMEMDPSTREKGRELQEMLRLFKETTTQPLTGFVLQTPTHKAGAPSAATTTKEKPRESPRLKAKLASDKSITRLAQDLVAKKCGAIQ
jgi:hypothetical protein